MNKIFTKHFIFWAAFFVLALLVLSTWQIQSNLADNIRLLEGETYYVNPKLPFVYIRGDQEGIILLNGSPLPQKAIHVPPPLNMEASGLGQVNLQLTLFGVIPLRQITVNVLPEVYLVPGGHSIGIRLSSRGVTVAGYYYFDHQGRSRSPGRESGIRVGDSLLAVEGTPIEDTGHTARLLNEASARNPGKAITIRVGREGKELEIPVQPLYSDADGDYRIGLYIRDSAAGVGTLSFYDPGSRRYGALGHIIMDSDTRQPVTISDGSIVQARIVNIRPARRGQPGEKTGVFVDQDTLRGTIDCNTPFGIFGTLHSFQGVPELEPEVLPMALANQVEIGPAEMLTVIEGEYIGRYSVEIERLVQQSRPSDKGIILRVVDAELLERTGGIVQGMSGSPIIQNGRLIGAVTHVFINDPSRGYGIFMEWMYHEVHRATKEIPPMNFPGN